MQIKGLADHVDDKQGVPGTLATLDNAQFLKEGKVSKLPGDTPLTTDIQGGGSLSGVTKYYSYENEILALAGHTMYSYSPTLNKWVNKGFCSSAFHTAKEVPSQMESQYNNKTIVFGGYRYFGDKVWDDTTGAFLGSHGAPLAELVVFNGHLYAVQYDSGAGTLQIGEMTSPLTAVSFSNISTGLGFGTLASVEVSGSYLYIVYWRSATGGHVWVNRLSTSLVAGTAVDVGAYTEKADAIAGSSGLLWVSVINSSGDRYITALSDDLILDFSPTLISGAYTSTGSSDIRRIAAVQSGSTLAVYMPVSTSGTGTDYDSIATNTITTSGTAGTATYFLRGFNIASHMFTLNSTDCMIVYSNQYLGANTGYVIDTSKNTYAVLNQESFTTSGNVYVSATNQLKFHTKIIRNPQVVTVSKISTSRRETITGKTGYQFIELWADGTYPPEALEINSVLHLSGSIAKIYDGVSVKHHGLLSAPFLQDFYTAGASGHLDAGTHSGAAVYEMEDAKGNIYKSPVSIKLDRSNPAVANRAAYFAIPHNSLITGLNPVLRRYRTVADGNIFYECTPESTITSAAAFTTVADADYYDSGSTDPLTDELPVYTTGGILDNAPNTPYRKGTIYNNRMVIAGCEVDRIINASKPLERYSGVSFAAGLDLSCEETENAEPVVAVMGMNSQLLIFKENNIYIRSGDFANNLGTNSSLSESEILSSNLGVKIEDVPSLIQTPIGIMFRSSLGGIYTATPQLQYIGAPVEDSDDLTINSAVVLADLPQVRFLTSSTTLIYDYVAQRWSRSTARTGVGSGLYNKTYFRGTAAGVAYVDTPSAFSTSAAFTSMRLVTNWISLAGIAGHQRVKRIYILGSYKSAHTLRIKIAYNYDPTYVQTEDVTPSSGDAYLHRIDLDQQKCTAFKISIEDVDSGTSGESYDFSGLMLEVGIKRGGIKLPFA